MVTLQTMSGNRGVHLQLLVTDLSTVCRLIHDPSCKSTDHIRGWVMWGGGVLGSPSMDWSTILGMIYDPSCESVYRLQRMGYGGLEGIDLLTDRQSVDGSIIRPASPPVKFWGCFLWASRRHRTTTRTDCRSPYGPWVKPMGCTCNF